METNKYPKFSVLLSLYIKEKPEYLKEAIDSILDQTLMPSEIVMVKDGPITEELQAILDDYSKRFSFFKVVGYEKNLGLGPALNFGLKYCSYDIVARMDTDDHAMPNRFEKEMEVLISKSVDIVGCQCYSFEDDISHPTSIRKMPETHEEIVEFSKTRSPFIHPVLMAYKKAYIESGGYEPWLLCEDYDLFVRMLEHGFKGYNIQECLLYLRESEDFYKRRGGIKYCKTIVKFKKMLYKKHWTPYGKYLKTKWSTIIVSLMPGFLRSFVYKNLLRKKLSKKEGK